MIKTLVSRKEAKRKMVNFNVAGKKKEAEPIEEEATGKALVTRFKSAFDVEPFRISFGEYRELIDKIVMEAKGLKIENPDGKVKAVEVGTSASKLMKMIEAKRKEINAPYNEFVGGVNAFANTFTDKLETIIATLKAKIKQYDAMLEQKRREEFLAQQKAHDEMQKKLDKDAKKTGTERVVLPEPTKPAAKEAVRTTTGTSYERTFIRYKVIDVSQVPYEYLVVDEAKVRFAINKNGIREIPGLEIYEEKNPQFRTT